MTILIQPSEGADRQPFDLTDRGLLLADGAFDTSLVINGKIFQREAHIERLLDNCAALEIEIDPQSINALIEQVILPESNGALRITVTRGPGGRGLAGETSAEPTLMARLSPPSPSRQFAPLSLQTSTISRNPDSLTSRHKTLSYTDNIMAVRRANAAGFDEALLLNTSGSVASAASGNIFIRQGERLLTPPLSEGALPGTMRKWMLYEAIGTGFLAIEAPISVDAIASADQIFVTNSLRLIAPVSRVDERDYDTAPLSPLVDKLKQQIAEL